MNARASDRAVRFLAVVFAALLLACVVAGLVLVLIGLAGLVLA